MIIFVLYVLGRKITELKCHFHHITSYYQYNITVDINFGHLAKEVLIFVIFLYCKISQYFPFSILSSLEESYYAHLILKECGCYVSLPWWQRIYINYCELFSVGIQIHSPIHLVSLFTYITVDVGICFILWIIIQYHFILLLKCFPPLAIGRSFSWLLCPFVVFPPLWVLLLLCALP